MMLRSDAGDRGGAVTDSGGAAAAIESGVPHRIELCNSTRRRA